MRRTLGLLLAFVWLMLAAAPVRAADSPVSLEAAAGFDGLSKAGPWVPVVATVENNGAETSGVLRFELQAENGGPVTARGIYETEVTLPAGATKQVELLMPTALTGTPELVLLKGGERLAGVPVQLEKTLDLLIGVLGADPAELPGLAGAQVGDRRFRLVRLDAGRLPAEPLALESLDALLLDRFAYGELAPERQAGVQAWVEHGGHLILAGGPEAHRLEALSSWVKLPVTGLERVTLAGIGEAQLSGVAPGDGWEPERRLGAQPLAFRRSVGRGAIHLLTFDPALEPMASWSGLPELIAGLLPSAAGQPGFGQGVAMRANASMMLGDTVAQFPLHMPATKWPLILLGIYAVVVGPLHFLLLRSFRHTAWALLTLPVLVGAGGWGVWTYSHQEHVSAVLVNQITVLEGQPGAQNLRVRSVAGLFLPPGARHQVALGGALLTPLPVAQMTPNGNPETEVKKTSFTGGRIATVDSGERWGLQAVGAEALVPVSGTVEGGLVIDTSQLTGRLTSRLPYRLDGAMVICGTSSKQIGTLAPGAAVDVTLSTPASAQQVAGANVIGQALANAMNKRVGPNPTAEEFELMRRQQTAWAASNAVSWLWTDIPPMAVLVGWTDQQPLAVSVDGRPAGRSEQALYVQPLPVSLSDGAFELPAGLVGGRVVEHSGVNRAGSLRMGWNIAKGESTVIDFPVPAAAAGRINEVMLRIPVMKRSTNDYPLQVSFYRWTDGTWLPVKMELDSGGPGPDPAFVSETGTVRVKVTGVSEQRLPLGSPGLIVKGRGVTP